MKIGHRKCTLRTNGALKDLIGSFTLSQIQDPIWCFRGPLSRVARRTPMLWCSEAPLRCFGAPHIMFFEEPLIVPLGHPVLTCMPLRSWCIYIMTSGSFRGPLSIVGASWYLIPRIGPSRLEGAVRDLIQFGVLCSGIGWVYLWCDCVSCFQSK